MQCDALFMSWLLRLHSHELWPNEQKCQKLHRTDYSHVTLSMLIPTSITLKIYSDIISTSKTTTTKFVAHKFVWYIIILLLQLFSSISFVSDFSDQYSTNTDDAIICSIKKLEVFFWISLVWFGFVQQQ